MTPKQAHDELTRRMVDTGKKASQLVEEDPNLLPALDHANPQRTSRGHGEDRREEPLERVFNF